MNERTPLHQIVKFDEQFHRLDTIIITEPSIYGMYHNGGLAKSDSNDYIRDDYYDFSNDYDAYGITKVDTDFNILDNSPLETLQMEHT